MLEAVQYTTVTYCQIDYLIIKWSRAMQWSESINYNWLKIRQIDQFCHYR